MNWNLVLWFAGIMATFVGLKFVFVVFHTLFSKESMKGCLNSIGDKIENANERVVNKVKEKAEQRKARKQEMEKPTVSRVPY